MALDYAARYPSQIDASDPAYPQGKAQNVSVPGDGTGTPWERDLVNDILGPLQAALAEAALSPSGTPDNATTSQYLDALKAVIRAPLQALIEASADLSPKPSRTIPFHPSVFRPFKLSGAGGNAQAPVAGAGTGFRVSLVDANSALICPLNEILPTGADVTRIDLVLTPGTKSSPGRFSHNTYTFSATPAVGAHAEVEGVNTTGTALETLSLTTGFTTSAVPRYLVYNPVSLTSGADILEGLNITFDDPGPRNF